MKHICLLLMLLTFAGITCGQKNDTMTIKVFFHPDKLDPEILDCQKVAPVTRTIPKTAAVATAVARRTFQGADGGRSKRVFGLRAAGDERHPEKRRR